MSSTRLNDKIVANCPSNLVDYKNVKLLKKFISEKGKMLPRRNAGLTCKEQRAVENAIKRARFMALLPYISY